MKLSDLCNVYSGYALKNFNSNGIGVPVIKIGNINSVGNLDLNNCQYTTDEVNEKYFSKYGDIYVALSGATTGKTGIMVSNEKYIINQRVGIIRSIDDTISYEFIKYFLIYKTDEILAEASGCAQPNISPKQLAVYELPNYSIEKMCVIANKLNRIKSIINKRQQELDKLDELVKARFVEMFNCCDLAEQKEDWQPISKIGTIISGSTPKTTIAEYWDGEYRWITPAEIDNEAGYIYDSQRKITLDGAKSCSLTELPIDTVLLTSRAPIGKVALAGNTFFCNQGFKNIVCNNRINPLFLYTLLRLNTDYLNSLGRGATFKEISKKIVENIKIPVPSMDIQNQFATFVKQVDKSKFIYQKNI